MFEDLEVLAERLLAGAPVQDNAFEPVLDPDGSIVGRVVLLERLKAITEAELMVLYAGLAERAETWQDVHDPKREARVGPEDLVAAEIGPALHLAPVTASLRVRLAIEVVTRLPSTLAALRRGELDLGRVRAILDATFPLSDADAVTVEEIVLPGAVEQTAAELRAALRRAVITVDQAAAEKRRKQAVKERGVWTSHERDGTSNLRAVLSAVDTGELYDLIDQIARQTKTTGDTRSMDARRADALVWALLGRDPHLGPEDDDPPPPPSDPDQPPDPNLPLAPDRPSGPDQPPDADSDVDLASDPDATAAPDEPDPDDPGPAEPADLDTAPPDPTQTLINPAWRDHELNRFDRISELAALALSAMTTRRPPRLPWVTINHTTDHDGRPVDVGELQGYGPITAEYARHLLAAGAARVPDLPSGREPTPEQARTHDPPAWLDREVRARDGTCRFPGCRQPTHRVDLDHTIEFPRGLTVRTNLGGLCRRHHRVKGTGCWTVTQHADGIYQWTSTITGRTYTTYPRGTTGQWRGATNHQTVTERPAR